MLLFNDEMCENIVDSDDNRVVNRQTNSTLV